MVVRQVRHGPKSAEEGPKGTAAGPAQWAGRGRVVHPVLRLRLAGNSALPLEKRGALPAQGPEGALQAYQAHCLQQRLRWTEVDVLPPPRSWRPRDGMGRQDQPISGGTCSSTDRTRGRRRRRCPHSTAAGRPHSHQSVPWQLCRRRRPRSRGQRSDRPDRLPREPPHHTPRHPPRTPPPRRSSTRAAASDYLQGEGLPPEYGRSELLLKAGILAFATRRALSFLRAGGSAAPALGLAKRLSSTMLGYFA